MDAFQLDGSLALSDVEINLNEISYSSTDVSLDKSEGKKRSFLQQPRSYSSKIPGPSLSPKESTPDVGTPKTQPIPIPAQSVLKNTVSELVDSQEFFIGDRVTIGGIKTGTLLYFGSTHIAAGQWCGIALDEPDGIHDGLVNDVRYFTCRKGHGIFAPVERVKHLDIKSTLNNVSKIINTPSRISPIPSKSKVCQIDPLEHEFGLREFDDKCEADTDDDIIGLDENGILRDSDEGDDDDKQILKQTHRRKLPKLPRSGSQGLSRVQYMKMEVSGGKTEVDEAVEKLTMLNDDEIALVKGEVSELPPSTGGSSGGDPDSWSLSKDYLAMCDGNQRYLNITFDGDPESKASTQEASSQEPSEESPSPEFIFDQEMIEDGEFSTQPLEMSRDSSLGLLSSLVLDKNDLLYELADDIDDMYNPASQDTLEPNSQEKMPTPENQQNLDTSMEFDENDVECSTPFVEKVVTFRKDTADLNETYVQDKSSHDEQLDGTFVKGDAELNGTFVKAEVDINGTFTKASAPSELQSTFTKDTANSTFVKPTDQQVLNATFDMSYKKEVPLHEVVVNVKNNDLDKKEMVDSGISLRGSMTESAISMNSLRGSVMESSSVRGSMIDQSSHGVTSVHSPSGLVNSTSANMVEGVMGKSGDLVEGSYEDLKREVTQTELDGKQLQNSGEVIETELDDLQLRSDLRHGHQRRERPISYLSTTSADTGYVPDTDSEVGTLTLNSPQEWMDRGFHGNHEYGTDFPPGRRSVGFESSGERTSVLEPIPIESDSDLGTMTGDTDTETDRAEIVHPVEALETKLSGVVMADILESEQSEDEITQTGDVPESNANTTITLSEDKTEMADNSVTNPDSTFTLPESEANENTNNSGNGDSCETTESISMVMVIIADNEDGEKTEGQGQSDNKKDNKEKSKTPKKKKFNVVKDFKKPNTNVVSKLSEYFKAPLPPKPVKEDKTNTEEAKNKRNSLKGKIDFSKVTSKIDNKVIDNKVVEDKANGKETKAKEIIEKEPVKKVKRTPPKSKWDAIMSQMSDKKPPKPKTEVKSKLESILHAPPPVKKEEETPKPKRRISMGIPDYSKVQSKLSYTAAPKVTAPKTDNPVQKSKSEIARKSRDSPIRNKNQSPARDVPPDSLKTDMKEKIRRKSSPMSKTHASPSHSRSVDNSPNRSRKLSTKSDRLRNLSGSPKRPEIKDRMAHIDLGESLDGRGSRTGTGSVWSSRQSSVTDMSTTEVDDETSAKGLHRAMSEELVRRNSLNVETSSQASGTGETKVTKGERNMQRRKSSLVPPTNLLENTSDEGARIKGCPKIVKPVIRQHSAPSPLLGGGSNVSSVSSSNQVTSEKKTKHYRTRHERQVAFEELEEFDNSLNTVAPIARPEVFDQNRNKTKSKKDEKPKPPETVLAEVHTREVQRLEALCESRTKQLNLSKLQTQSCEKAFDGMAVVVNHLAHNLDAFTCPSLKSKVSTLESKVTTDTNRIQALEETKASLEQIIGRLKEEHKDYVNNLESESEKSLLYQREYLTNRHQHEIERMREQKNAAIFDLRKSHEEYVEQKRVEHLGAMEQIRYQHREDIKMLQGKQDHQMEGAMEQLRYQHREDIKMLQGKQDHQMEELHKQHQDKLEEITNRFDGIKCTLSEKVDCLRSECDRLRDRAKHCEEALQRDSDYKVQCALAPYKNLPQEIESLKLVVEMRNEEINKLRNQNAELQKKLEELPIAQEKIIALQQKKENLEAIISMKTDHEKTLHERCQNLMKKYDKESRANKRLSMEYEELMYKLSESFSETEEMSEQEAAFYKKLGMSPTNDIPGSPGGSRRLRSTSSSESSPSKSPHYRRPVSAILDTREDKKFKRRSGNFLLDEQRKNGQRPTSPLAKQQNPLTRSWSPSTQPPSSPLNSSDKSKNRLSQSWCVDVFDDDNEINLDSQRDFHNESGSTELDNSSEFENMNSSSEMKSSNTSERSVEKDTEIESEFHKGHKNVEPQLSERSRNSETPTKPKDNITDLTQDVSNVAKSLPVLERQRTFDRETDIDSEVSVQKRLSVDNSAVLSTASVKCPPSKIPTNLTAEKRETKIPTRSHRESAV